MSASGQVTLTLRAAETGHGKMSGMSEPQGPIGSFKRAMEEHIRNSPVGDFERAFRRNNGLEETVDSARRAAHKLAPSEESEVLDAINKLAEDAANSDTRATVYFWVGLGVGVAGLVLGVVGIVAGS